MARESGGGNPFGYLFLGFLAGIAATLGALILLSGDDRGRHDPDEDETPAAEATAHPARPRHAEEAAPVEEPAPTPAPAQEGARRAPPPSAGSQVDYDAAAAGMTTRR